MKNIVKKFRYAVGFLDGSASAGQQLSKIFEEEAGLKGIAAAYAFPDNMNATEFDHWAGAYCSLTDDNTLSEQRHLKNVWQKLQALNPELQRVETGDECDFLRDAIYGTASLYNPDDLSFFIDFKKHVDSDMVRYFSMQHKDYAARDKFITDRTNIARQWVAGPETLMRIQEQVAGRPVLVDTPPSFFYLGRRHISKDTSKAAQNFISQRLKKAS